MSAPAPQVGDVLRFTVFRWDRDAPNIATPPFFGVVAHAWRDGDAGEVMLLPPRPDATSESDVVENWAYNDTDDVYEIVPPEAWPDEVCVAMALRTLGISVND